MVRDFEHIMITYNPDLNANCFINKVVSYDSYLIGHLHSKYSFLFYYDRSYTNITFFILHIYSTPIKEYFYFKI